MGKADLKVTVGLLVLGVALGAILLRVMNPPTNQHQQTTGQPGIVRLGTTPQAPPAAAVPPHPTEPLSPPPAEPLYAIRAKIIQIDPERREILADFMPPTSEPLSEEEEDEKSRPKKVIQLTDTTRLEKRIVEKAPPGQPDKIVTQGLRLEDLHRGEVVFCTYRTETPEALQQVESLSLIMEMDIDAYLNSEEYTAWQAKQPAYVKGRIVAIDPARRTITYQGYVVNRIPKGFPRQTVVVGQGAQVYEVEDESRLDTPQRRRALNELRPGQTILFPVTRALLQTGAKTYHTDTILVIGKGG